MSSVRFLRACYHTGVGNAVRKPTVASVKTHTMGHSLSEYLRMKVHPDIHNNPWSQVVVKGEHLRDPSLVRISSIEKKDKPFNWQRPTASAINSKTFQLHCFPGIDYVQHYAAIMATYLSLTGGQQDIVQYTALSARMLGTSLKFQSGRNGSY